MSAERGVVQREEVPAVGWAVAGAPERGDAGALLVTGTVGVGKTSVAGAVGELLAARGVPHAVIDLDWLRQAWPSPPGDPFQRALTLRNLRSVAGNLLAAGAERLVLAGVIESRAEIDEHEAALGVRLAVCRLRADPEVVRGRLLRRHELDAAGREWFLKRATELDAIMDRAQVEDVTVDATGTPDVVAAAVLAAVEP